MRKRNLSQLEKQKLQSNQNCPLCGQGFYPMDDFQIIKVPVGQYIVYSFIHDSCIVDSANIPQNVKRTFYQNRIKTAASLYGDAVMKMMEEEENCNGKES